ncbi:unnamed protein product [Spodoptera littoralis]|uniref:Pro-resilin n=1 Tax=Spodoptera littoralis TaxID=7109 RepID=A0A9P0I7M2_SPOLI|nr:unnamed protein product [Spodoptera littoralis]CAH1642563.1 unnamed protein product [Spodoptera littoralis]
MKLLLISALAVVCLAEPPVDNRYLPPQSGGGAPSALYGAPGTGFQRQTDAVFRYTKAVAHPALVVVVLRPSTVLLAQAKANSTHHPPNTVHLDKETSHHRSMELRLNLDHNLPNSDHLRPSTVPHLPSSDLLQLSTELRLPSLDLHLPSMVLHQPMLLLSNMVLLDLAVLVGGSFGGQSYRGQEQSRQYLPPGSGANGYGADDGSNGEPANYNFEYMVKDDASGNDFGHRESRQGDRAEGLYYVLLPDGRKQTVQYEADQDGYKPKISYEDTGLGQGGYDRNSQSGYNGNGNGYQGQGGPY